MVKYAFNCNQYTCMLSRYGERFIVAMNEGGRPIFFCSFFFSAGKISQVSRHQLVYLNQVAGQAIQNYYLIAGRSDRNLLRLACSRILKEIY